MTILHRLLKINYLDILKTVHIIISPRSNKLFWKFHSKKSDSSYLLNINDSRNTFLVENLVLKNASSFLEIGCNVGNRIINIALKNPDTNFFGIDIDKKAIEVGNLIIEDRGIKNIKLYYLDLTNKEGFERLFPEGIDYICSWAVLMYVHPLYIRRVLKNVLKISNKHVVFVEPATKNRLSTVTTGTISLGTRNWAYNYRKLIQKLEPNIWLISESEVPKDIWSPGGKDKPIKFIGSKIEI